MQTTDLIERLATDLRPTRFVPNNKLQPVVGAQPIAG